jgi:hypothetical protein
LLSAGVFLLFFGAFAACGNAKLVKASRRGWIHPTPPISTYWEDKFPCNSVREE